MAASTFHPRRRRFIRLAMVGAAMTPLASALTSGSATADELISESDPAALRLKCKADAATAHEPDRVLGRWPALHEQERRVGLPLRARRPARRGEELVHFLDRLKPTQ
jgi:hypothetical protein